MQQVGCYRRYTGRDANVVATAALDPKPPINGEDKIYSALMLAALMIRRHFSISAFCLSAARTGDRGGAPKGGGQKRRFHVHVWSSPRHTAKGAHFVAGLSTFRNFPEGVQFPQLSISRQSSLTVPVARSRGIRSGECCFLSRS
jgi:hypothetical protein